MGSSLSSRQEEMDVPAQRQAGSKSGSLTSALCSVLGDWTAPHAGEGIRLTQHTLRHPEPQTHPG